MPLSDVEVSNHSALQALLGGSAQLIGESVHPPHYHHLASAVLYNLQYQHDWSALTIHSTSSLTGKLLLRPLISGLPPRRAYVHPDEQVEILKAEHETGKSIAQHAEREWILPTHLSEKWSLRSFAQVFDTIETVPPVVDGQDQEDIEDEDPVGQKWRGKNRQKRLLLATLHDDSTVVYYIMHDGIVKPRQN